MTYPEQNRVAVVVEDEWLIRMDVAGTLADAGWEVVEFSTGEEAIEFVHAEAGIDLLVTDIRLAGEITGWEVAKVYRSSLPDLAIVYHSASPPASDGDLDGVFLCKPCPPPMLIDAITRFTERHTPATHRAYSTNVSS